MKRYETRHEFNEQIILADNFKNFLNDRSREDPIATMLKKALKEHKRVKLGKRRDGTPLIATSYGFVEILSATDLIGAELIVDPTMTSLMTIDGQVSAISEERLDSLRRIAPRRPRLVLFRKNLVFVFDDQESSTYLIHRRNYRRIVLRKRKQQ